MNKQSLVLSGVGLILLWFSIIRGGLSTGYGMGTIPILLRIGVAYISLGALTALLRPISARKGYLNALGTAVVIFAVGVSIMYYDLGVHPPEYGTLLTTPRLVGTQIQLLLIMLSIPAGYISGVLMREEKHLMSMFILPTAVVVGAFGGTIVAIEQGSHPGFTTVFFFGATLVVAVFSLLPLSVMWRFDPNSTVFEWGG